MIILCVYSGIIRVVTLDDASVFQKGDILVVSAHVERGREDTKMDSDALKNVLKFLSLIGMSVTLFLLLPVLIGILYQEDMTAFFLFDAFYCFLSTLYSTYF